MVATSLRRVAVLVAFGVVLGAAAASGASAAAAAVVTAVGAPAAAAPTVNAAPIDCRALITADQIAAFDSAGFALGDDHSFVFSSVAPGSGFGVEETSCTWGVPNSDNLTFYAYTALDPTQSEAEQAALLAQGYTGVETDYGTVYPVNPDLNEFESAFFGKTHLFAGGYWFISPSPDALLTMVEAVLPAERSPATGATGATSAPDAPLTCDALLTSQQRFLLAATEQVPSATTVTPSEPFTSRGGLACAWGELLMLAYAPVDAADVPALEAEALSQGYFLVDGVYSGGLSAWAGEQLFTDGYWFSTYRITRDIPIGYDARELRDIVLGALQTDEPAEVEEIVDELEPATPAETVPIETEPAGSFGSGRANEPSVLSTLGTIQNLDLPPERAALSAGIVLVFAAIVGFPGKLMESALSAHYDRLLLSARPLGVRLRALGERMSRRRVPASRARRAILLTAAIAAAAVLSAFIEPSFGFTPESLRLLASIGVTLLLESLLGTWLIARHLRRVEPDSGAGFQFRYGSLAIILLAVLVSRLTGFDPGILFGLIIGVGLARELGARRERTTTAQELGYTFGLGLAAWLLYSLLTAVLLGRGTLAVFSIETFSALTIACLSALPIVMLPWRGLPGATLYAWNRWLWLAAYAIALFAFLVVLLPLPGSWEQITTPFWLWVGLYLGYAVVAVVVWAVLSRSLGRASEAAPQDAPGRAS